MPPGPAYNWLCVLAGAADIAGRAARLRAAQLGVTRAAAASATREQATAPTNLATRTEDAVRLDVHDAQPIEVRQTSEHVIPAPATTADGSTNARQATIRVDQPANAPGSIFNSREERARLSERVSVKEAPVNRSADDAPAPSTKQPNPIPPPHEPLASSPPPSQPTPPSFAVTPSARTPAPAVPPVEPERPTVASLVDVTPPTPAEATAEQSPAASPQVARQLSSSRVPSSRIGRLFHYGGLAASLGYGAASEMIRRTAQGSEASQSSLMMTEANIGRLVAKLSQMRGAALKLGQFMSIQDTHLLPPDLDAVFRRVQDSAHYMPDTQFETVMREALGEDWMSNFASFERIPFAAASIGQVHRAELKASAVLDPSTAPAINANGTIPVAVKVQFPNIARSIASDLGYLRTLLTAGRLLPKGLFLNKTLDVMKGELADECDYTREAAMARKFSHFVQTDDRFMVPWVWPGSTKEVLVMERVNGISVGEERVKRLPKERRDEIAERVIELCLRELFTWRTMQTDPNWSNFLWDEAQGKIQLVDFGATREYSKWFMDSWLRLLQAAASGDREACVRWSTQVGYLTGAEEEVMVNAHVRSMTLLATPFRDTTPMPISFGPASSWADITNEIRALIPTMLKHRLTPPPRETYSLNRKLSGAFLLAARLDATVDTRALWEKVVREYRFEGEREGESA